MVEYSAINIHMSEFINTTETAKWIVAHNGVDIYHPVILESHQTLGSGQPYLEIFNTAEEAITAFPQVSAAFTLAPLN